VRQRGLLLPHPKDIYKLKENKVQKRGGHKPKPSKRQKTIERDIRASIENL
jgi:hypothetical protein